MDDNQGGSPGPIRRHAGDYLKIEFLAEALGPWAPALLGLGMLVGSVVALWLGTYFAGLSGITVLVSSLFLWGWRRRERHAFRKGHIAERQIGRALEQAITAKGCSIAHNVTKVMDSGDVDHIVATPQSVWVIETKYRRVPDKNFPKVLSRLHACRAKIEALLPAGTPVRACLVLAYEEGGVERERDGILVFNNHTFRTGFLPSLKVEQVGSAVDGRVSGVIWGLSRGEATTELVEAEKQDVVVDRRSTHRTPSRTSEISQRFPNRGQRWTEEDDRTLRRLHKAGWNVARLADHFGRRQGAIRSRLRKLRNG